MEFHLPTAELFIPDGTPAPQALARTTHLAIAAHEDDIEIMAIDGILQCYRQPDRWFTGVVVTNGSGSPRDDLYAAYTDEEMQRVRRQEQRAAAVLGDYAAQVLLDYPSATVKAPHAAAVITDLEQILLATRPQVVYTHNLADKHDTRCASCPPKRVPPPSMAARSGARWIGCWTRKRSPSIARRARASRPRC